MKRNLLFITLIAFALGSTPTLSGAASKVALPENQSQTEAAAPAKISSKHERWAKRFERLEKKIQKKMDRLRRKGKVGDGINLGAMLGLIVLLTGGLFIALGLVIPAVGIVFLVIGIIIAFAGLLLWLLLGGISVEVS